VVGREELLAMQRAIENVHVAESVGRYIVAVVAATRESSSVEVGASPRGTLALMKLARVKAALDGRDFVVPDDVKAIAAPALAHRLVLRPELWVQRVHAEDVVQECLAAVPVPPAEPERP
jgi:MoxR-like ATPase